MSFNSVEYIIFLVLVVLLYYTISQKYRNGLLLIASYFFYMCWNVKCGFLMIMITVITYFCGKNISASDKQKKSHLILGLVSCLFILVFFKYYNFLYENIEEVIRCINGKGSVQPLNIILPMGISFYTLQAMGYIIDVYRENTVAEKNFVLYALYISFFPQLVAGPIERARDILPQFKNKHSVEINNIKDGMRLVVFGLFQKVAIADVCAICVNQIYNNIELYKGAILIIATILFTIQIYCDFAGYSNIARGSGLLLGFRLRENFRAPYLSSTPSEFYNRWHISLSSWFRDYVYFPLGGSKRGNVYCNLMCVMLISGLWHGAAWHFVLWGLFWGIIIALDKFIYSKKCVNCKWKKIVYGICTSFCIVMSWSLFRINNLNEYLYYVKNVFSFCSLQDFISSCVQIENAVYFKSLTFGIFWLLTIIINSLILIKIDIRLKNSENTYLVENVLKDIEGRKKECSYIYMLLNIIIWGLIQQGAYVATADFIYFQF